VSRERAEQSRGRAEAQREARPHRIARYRVDVRSHDDMAGFTRDDVDTSAKSSSTPSLDVAHDARRERF